MSHYKIVCNLCSTVISQCRCMSGDKTTTYELCNACKSKPPKENVTQNTTCKNCEEPFNKGYNACLEYQDIPTYKGFSAIEFTKLIEENNDMRAELKEFKLGVVIRNYKELGEELKKHYRYYGGEKSHHVLEILEKFGFKIYEEYWHGMGYKDKELKDLVEASRKRINKNG